MLILLFPICSVQPGANPHCVIVSHLSDVNVELTQSQYQLLLGVLDDNLTAKPVAAVKDVSTAVAQPVAATVGVSSTSNASSASASASASSRHVIYRYNNPDVLLTTLDIRFDVRHVALQLHMPARISSTLDVPLCSFSIHGLSLAYQLIVDGSMITEICAHSIGLTDTRPINSTTPCQYQKLMYPFHETKKSTKDQQVEMIETDTGMSDVTTKGEDDIETDTGETTGESSDELRFIWKVSPMKSSHAMASPPSTSGPIPVSEQSHDYSLTLTHPCIVVTDCIFHIAAFFTRDIEMTASNITQKVIANANVATTPVSGELTSQTPSPVTSITSTEITSPRSTSNGRTPTTSTQTLTDWSVTITTARILMIHDQTDIHSRAAVMTCDARVTMHDIRTILVEESEDDRTRVPSIDHKMDVETTATTNIAYRK